MRLTFRVGEPNTLYTEQAAAGAVGKQVPVTVEGESVGTAEVVGCEVIEDGRAMAITLEGTDLLVASIRELGMI